MAESIQRQHGGRARERGAAMPAAILASLALAATVLAILEVLPALRRQTMAPRHLAEARYAAGNRVIREVLESDGVAVTGPGGTAAADYGGGETVQRFPWGGFELVRAEARRGPFRVTVAGLAGRRPRPESVAMAIAVGPESLPLSVGGTSRIRGAIATGNAAVVTEPGYDGWQGTSRLLANATVPEPDREALTRYLSRIFPLARDGGVRFMARPPGVERGSAWPVREARVPRGGLWKGDEIRLATTARHLRGPLRIAGPLLLVATAPLILEAVEVEGPLLIISSAAVTLRAVRGAGVQVISRRVIRVEGETHLAYPGWLWVHGDDADGIEVTTGSRLSGGVVLSGTERHSAPGSTAPRLRIEAGAVVDGLVFSDRLVEIDGRISGLVRARRWFARVSPGIRLNAIRGGTVDRAALSDSLLLPRFFRRPGDHAAVVPLTESVAEVHR